MNMNNIIKNLNESQKPHETFVLNEYLDDLYSKQLTLLLNWLWANNYKVSKSNIRLWRKKNNLDIER